MFTFSAEPRVLIACADCGVNDDNPRTWFDCADTDLYTDEDLIAELHDGDTDHTRLIVVDADNFPDEVTRTVTNAREVGDAFNALDDSDQWPALMAWAEDGNGFLNDVETFQENYVASAESWHDWATGEAEQMLSDANVPDHIVTYFDWDVYAEDLRTEYTIIECGDTCHIFY